MYREGYATHMGCRVDCLAGLGVRFNPCNDMRFSGVEEIKCSSHLKDVGHLDTSEGCHTPERCNRCNRLQQEQGFQETEHMLPSPWHLTTCASEGSCGGIMHEDASRHCIRKRRSDHTLLKDVTGVGDKSSTTKEGEDFDSIPLRWTCLCLFPLASQVFFKNLPRSSWPSPGLQAGSP